MGDAGVGAMDLNLLLVFRAIHEERSLTRASARLGIGQSAVSHALRRLRALVDDPLFIRTQAGVQPTAEADELAAPINEALALIESSLGRRKAFDARTSDRRFRLALSDVGELVYIPLLLDALSHEAPSVDLEVVPVDAAKLTEALRTGEVDLAVGYLPDLAGTTRHALAFQDRQVCVVRSGHPLRARTMSLAAFGMLAHVAVSSRCSAHRDVEELLQAQEVRRRIALRLPHLGTIPNVLECTDLVATLPFTVARFFGQRSRLRIYEHPARLPPIDVTIHWHARFDHDPGNAWLRGRLLALLRTCGDGNAITLPSRSRRRGSPSTSARTA
jgi:DNA-binding transcriptional LysR family regulator